jgi:hypothetical protein
MLLPDFSFVDVFALVSSLITIIHAVSPFLRSKPEEGKRPRRRRAAHSKTRNPARKTSSSVGADDLSTRALLPFRV